MSERDHRARFWGKVDKSASCWTWQGSLTGAGYGRFFLDYGYKLAHRYAWELANGPIGVGLVIDHLCRNRVCVNPDHMEPVTPRENTLRGVGFTAINARRKACPRNHPYDATNTYVSPDGARHCRICQAHHKGRALLDAAPAGGAECQGCVCQSEHDGDYGASGHPGSCPPHTCALDTPSEVPHD